MDESDLAALIKAGDLLFATKLFLVAVDFLWVYDYFLTLGDEIQYAWSGRKSWVFALFIGNRYTPLLHVVWIYIVMFDYTNCQETAWISIFYTTAETVFAQITITLRIYAVTNRNKLFNGALVVLVAANLFFGMYSTVRFALAPPEQLPEIDLDAFKVCFHDQWRLGELLFIVLTIAFDVLAFLMILVTTMRLRRSGHSSIPTILDSIQRDAAVYFMLIFASQLLFLLLWFFIPGNIQLLPGARACAIITPIMASRLMLSLKKAAVEPMGPWSLTANGETSSGDRTLRFASQTFSGPCETLETSTLSNEDIELESTRQSSRNPGSQQPC